MKARSEDRVQVEFSELTDIAISHGIFHLGVAPAAIMDRARTALIERKAAGLHGTMQFTYRNPERSTDPRSTVSDAQSVIVAARSYQLPGSETAKTGAAAGGAAVSGTAGGDLTGRVARYAQVDHYALLIAGLQEVADRLKSAGYRAVVLCDDNAIVDREIAYLGGLGWFGKNANLLVPGAGSYFVLGCVVTNAEYPVSTPVADGCGGCVRCLDSCPTGAICAPGVIDANRCLAWLVQQGGTFPEEFRVALGDRMYGCDDCQESCPPTIRFSSRRPAAVPEGTPVMDRVDLREFFTASDDDLLRRYGRWYVADRNPRWWRRNALIIIGNTATEADHWVSGLLHEYAAGDDPILAEHAQWALNRLGDRGVEI
jgi:epoxyqueuosine reductase